MSKSPLIPNLQRRERRVLTDDVADSIREAILSGRLKGGDRLIEDELAESLNVSRGPIRQAIFRLEQEGLVVHETHRGATVAEVSVEDAAEIYSLRQALERLAIASACERATEADLAPLDAILVLFQSIPRSSITRRRVAELDIDFHDALFRASHHGRLCRAWEALRSQIFVFLLLRDGLPDDYLTSWYRDHSRLLQVVRSRDKDLAMATIEEHIGGAYARLLEHMAQHDVLRIQAS
ncbi:GntR family transcriptional regulator [Kaistia dalseonensis]|uniref:DNA-binding GntR family transcriptional regulator n=1 Tax=Kaistia dalseonensis TaxID=410840 RepID=A0ABU0H2U7_9HYPH|nr:GntR family transcriptional regulator [Kaistia dalseonensis]MCX5494050.1 GntR family transcriptional regulator [Kaistia dalseonensis]MDQ0436628.1 DNA-binding GntR family transcriptional regulator [Kaistia dalseonensis]